MFIAVIFPYFWPGQALALRTLKKKYMPGWSSPAYTLSSQFPPFSVLSSQLPAPSSPFPAPSSPFSVPSSPFPAPSSPFKNTLFTKVPEVRLPTRIPHPHRLSKVLAGQLHFSQLAQTDATQVEQRALHILDFEEALNVGDALFIVS